MSTKVSIPKQNDVSPNNCSVSSLHNGANLYIKNVPLKNKFNGYFCVNITVNCAEIKICCVGQIRSGWHCYE